MFDRSTRRWVCAVMMVLGLTGGVLAHHGVTGQYDASVPIVLAGRVTAATFAPPHPVISVRVTGAEPPEFAVGRPAEYFGPATVRREDLGQVRQVELSPVRMFYDLAQRIRVGAEVTIVALRNCRSPHQLRSTWLRLQDGTVISYTGDWAPGVDGCR